jgi:hypothetical protein
MVGGSGNQHVVPYAVTPKRENGRSVSKHVRGLPRCGHVVVVRFGACTFILRVPSRDVRTVSGSGKRKNMISNMGGGGGIKLRLSAIVHAALPDPRRRVVTVRVARLAGRVRGAGGVSLAVHGQARSPLRCGRGEWGGGGGRGGTHVSSSGERRVGS